MSEEIVSLQLSKIVKKKKLRSDFAVIKIEDFSSEILKEGTFKNKFYSIWIFHKAEGNLVIDDESFNLKTNTLYFINYHQVYQFIDTENCNGYVILFTKSFYNIIYTGNKIIKSENALSKIKPATILSSELKKDVQKLFEHIKKEYENTKLLYTEIICLLLKTMILNVLRESGEIINLHNQSDRKKTIVSDFSNLVDQHYKEYKTTSFYAKKLSLTANYLNSIIKDQLEIPAGKFIQNRTILEAERLLLHTTLSVTEIAYELGFSDKSHFGKYFKASKKVSPQRYRTSQVETIFQNN